MAVADQRAIIAIDHQTIMKGIHARLKRAWQLAEGLPPAQRDQLRANIDAAYDEGIEGLSKLIVSATVTLKSAGQYVDNATALATEMQSQRDKVADELHKLLADLDRMNTGNPVVGKIYEEAEDSVREFFYMQMSYSLAETIGEGWTHHEAEYLHTVLTAETDGMSDDDIHYDYGIEAEALRTCRAEILQAIHKLMGKSS